MASIIISITGEVGLASDLVYQGYLCYMIWRDEFELDVA